MALAAAYRLPLAGAVRLLTLLGRAFSGGVAALGREPRQRKQLLGCQPVVPRGYAHRYAQRQPTPLDVELDRVQPAERASRDDLPTPLVRAGQHDQQLALSGVPDAVEASQLWRKRRSEVGERLRGQLRAMRLGQMLDFVEAYEQTAKRGVVALGASDLLLQARGQLWRGERVVWSPCGTR
jgi:hypothetical protein